MVCLDLTCVPAVPVPSGFVMRHYSVNDEENWTRIHLDAEPYHVITSETFGRIFGSDELILKQRQLYVCTVTGLAVGTVTAWFDDNYYGEKWGRIHWLAVLRQYQRRGLGRALVSRACRVLLALGHSRAYLATQAGRIGAIKLYLELGFVPEIRTDEDRRAWQYVRDAALAQGFCQSLSEPCG